MHDLVPIAVCVVLPVMVVLIICLKLVYADKKRADVLMKAIETNPNVDVEHFAKLFTKANLSPVEIRNRRLQRGCIFSLGGLVAILFVVTIVLFNVTTMNGELGLLLLAGGISMAVGISYLIVWKLTGRNSSEAQEK